MVGSVFFPALIPASVQQLLLENSISLNGTNESLSRTPGTAGNRKTWSFDVWVKYDAANTSQVIFAAGDASLDRINLFFDSNHILLQEQVSSTFTINYISNALFRNTAWYHIAVVVDTTQATSTDRVKIYVNGVQITSWSTSTAPAQNYDTFVNSTATHRLGSVSYSAAAFYSGLLAYPRLIDGATPDITDLIDIDGIWIAPKELSGVTIPAYTTQIPQATGTQIGDMTDRAGVSASFDGNTSQPLLSASSNNGSLTGFVGKFWGSGNAKTITAFNVYSTSDYGFSSNVTTGTVTLQLQGSNTGAWSGEEVTLLTDSFANASTLITKSYDTTDGINTTNPYLYHRVLVTAPIASASMCELELFEDVAEQSNSLGINGFNLDFSDSADLGNDVSENADALSLIDASGLSYFGDMSDLGGRSAAFDGDTSKTASQCAADDTDGATAYCGVDWGVGNTKNIAGFAVYGSSDQGFLKSGSFTFTLTLYGSNSSPANATDGTALFTSGSITEVENANPQSFLSGLTSGDYRYHWITITPSSNRGAYFAEVQFFEAGADFTLNNIDSSNQSRNSPVDDPNGVFGLFAALDPNTLRGGTAAPTNGNLKFDPGTTGDSSIHATIRVPAGENVYVEGIYTVEVGLGSRCRLGVNTVGDTGSFVKGGSTTNYWAFDFCEDAAGSGASAFDEGSETSGYSEPATGSKIGMFIKNGNMYVHDDGNYYNSGDPDGETGAVITGIPTDEDLFIHVSIDAGGVNRSSLDLNFGQKTLSHEPTGAFLLATQNLPADDPNYAAPPKQYRQFVNAIQTDTANTSSDATDYSGTFDGMDVGSTDDEGYVVATITAYESDSDSDLALSSVTIGGQSATIVTQANSARNYAGIVIAPAASGTTADVDIVFNETAIQCAVTLYRVKGINGTATDTAASTAKPMSTTALDIPAGGWAVGVAREIGGGNTFTWTELIEDATGTHGGEGEAFSSASLGIALNRPRTITCTCTSTPTTNVMALAAFELG